MKIDCVLKFSEKSGHIRPKNPMKVQPNPPENIVNPREYPGELALESSNTI